MNEEYTLTTEQVRETYELGSRLPARRRTDFDRWLATHDAKVKAEALEEAAGMIADQEDPERPSSADVRRAIGWVLGRLRARAAEYRSGART